MLVEPLVVVGGLEADILSLGLCPLCLLVVAVQVRALLLSLTVLLVRAVRFPVVTINALAVSP